MTARQRGFVLSGFGRWLFDRRGSADTTRDAYARRVLGAEKWLVEHSGTSIIWATEKDLRRYLFSITPTARNRNHCRQALVAFGDFLVENGYAKENVARQLPRLKQRAALPKALTHEQATAVIDAAKSLSPLHGVIVSTLIYTGLRHNAARHLEWNNIDFNGGWIVTVEKGDRDHVIALHPVLKADLESWRGLSASPWVFPSSRIDGPISQTWMGHLVNEVGEEAGVKLHPHLLRHTFATLLLESGVNLPTIKEALGHANIATTSIYLRVRNVNLKEAVNSLSLET